jgi:hypothetical protein
MRPNRPTPHNTGSAGLLITANSENGVAIFTGYDLEPGDVRSGRVTIANRSPAAGRFKLTEAEASNNFSSGELTLAIDDITDDDDHLSVFGGEIGGLPTGGIDLGCFEPGQSRRFRFLVMLDLNASNPDRDMGAGAAYEWDFAPDGATGSVSCASFREGR